MLGPYPATPGEVVSAILRIWRHARHGPIDTILFQIRLPRVLAALAVGAALAAAGASYQTLFRNPLVSPDILGVSAGAGFGAVLGILLSLPVLGIQVLGFATGLATVLLVYGLARALRSQNEILVLVLAGIVVGALAGAGISLVKVLADPYDQLPGHHLLAARQPGGHQAERRADRRAAGDRRPRAAGARCAGGSACCRSATTRRGRSASTCRLVRGVVIAGGDADHRDGGVGLRRDRLDRPGRAAHGAHAGRAALRPPAAGVAAAGRAPSCVLSTRSRAPPRASRSRSACSPRSSARRSSSGCWRAAGGCGADDARSARPVDRLRHAPRRARHRSRARARRGAVPARAQRRRQDDAVQDPARPDPGARRRGPARRTGRSRR